MFDTSVDCREPQASHKRSKHPTPKHFTTKKTLPPTLSPPPHEKPHTDRIPDGGWQARAGGRTTSGAHCTHHRPRRSSQGKHSGKKATAPARAPSRTRTPCSRRSWARTASPTRRHPAAAAAADFLLPPPKRKPAKNKSTETPPTPTLPSSAVAAGNASAPTVAPVPRPRRPLQAGGRSQPPGNPLCRVPRSRRLSRTPAGRPRAPRTRPPPPLPASLLLGGGCRQTASSRPRWRCTGGVCPAREQRSECVGIEKKDACGHGKNTEGRWTILKSAPAVAGGADLDETPRTRASRISQTKPVHVCKKPAADGPSKMFQPFQTVEHNHLHTSKLHGRRTKQTHLPKPLDNSGHGGANPEAPSFWAACFCVQTGTPTRSRDRHTGVRAPSPPANKPARGEYEQQRPPTRENAPPCSGAGGTRTGTQGSRG